MKIRLFLFTFFITLIFRSVFPQIQSQKYLKGATITGIVDVGNFLWIATYGQGIYSYDKATDEWSNYSTLEKNGLSDFFFTIAE